jgi:hypothetical protein
MALEVHWLRRRRPAFEVFDPGQSAGDKSPYALDMPNAEQSPQVDQNAGAARCTDRRPVSAVKLSAELTASVDAWARAHGIHRSEALGRLVAIGLRSEPASAAHTLRFDALAVEELAASQIDRFIDPDTPLDERERRIHRLTEGPPEFVDVRIDLPKRGP